MFGDKPRDLPMQIALILVPEFTLLPVTSVIDPLRLANRQSERGLYVWTTHSVDGAPVTASNGITLMPDGDLDSIPEHATIIVCGGTNVHKYADKPCSTGSGKPPVPARISAPCVPVHNCCHGWFARWLYVHNPLGEPARLHRGIP
jgi:hypothetical protein